MPNAMDMTGRLRFAKGGGTPDGRNMRIDQTSADHGGDIDAAIARFGGARTHWLDLSTGINRVPYPLPRLLAPVWRDLPDAVATAGLETAARAFWSVPADAAVLAAPGASSVIARLPGLMLPATVAIPGPTYNEHARAFRAAGWALAEGRTEARVVVNPNNPDGRLWTATECIAPLMVIDESFGDVAAEHSLMELATRPGTLILKSFGKFWGLAGLRLGFAIGDPTLVAGLARMLGPWPVSGAALAVGTKALGDQAWADQTRRRLRRDAQRLDAMMARAGAGLAGGTDLFRLYDVGDARGWQDHFARAHIWTRRFPYSDRWLRVGLPGSRAEWDRVDAALHRPQG
jgi:cobalamin biosynthesis protein CobC